ncbi:hypothetical protein ISF6_1121 [Piscinibacter sakaiensis]|uniref:Prepilin-type N-terminal cleavage/methylation domain-containing protein n=2 Tax=Piscinibacter sakaiensis TaxID=1547922 RepID=A0A0K8NTX0_PISS1|nr:hypothetical protein ISF6_1121 [Piscinibacter sakaiensis]
MHARPSAPRATALRRRGQQGLTLVELLVSMLIMGFVLTLVSQAIYQVSQVTRSAQDVSAAMARQWSGGWAASPVFANLVAPPEAPEGRAFEGSEDRIAGYTALPVDGGDRGLQAFVMELRDAADGATGSELRATTLSPTGVPGPTTVIARFAARAGFAYADAAGRLSAQWPVGPVSGGRDLPELPNAVAVRRRDDGTLLMWYPFDGDTRRPRRASTPFGESGRPSP